MVLSILLHRSINPSQAESLRYLFARSSVSRNVNFVVIVVTIGVVSPDRSVKLAAFAVSITGATWIEHRQALIEVRSDPLRTNLGCRRCGRQVDEAGI